MNFSTAENNLQTLKYYTGFICCSSYEDAMNSPKRHAKLIQFGLVALSQYLNDSVVTLIAGNGVISCCFHSGMLYVCSAHQGTTFLSWKVEPVVRSLILPASLPPWIQNDLSNYANIQLGKKKKKLFVE